MDFHCVSVRIRKESIELLPLNDTKQKTFYRVSLWIYEKLNTKTKIIFLIPSQLIKQKEIKKNASFFP